MTIKPMTLLLIEDDADERARFIEFAKFRGDVKFVGATASSIEGFKLFKQLLPEGVILDIELNKGAGSGIDFLNRLKASNITPKPIITVITNTPSNLVHNVVRDLGVDYIFYKRQPGFEPKIVADLLLLMRVTLTQDQCADFTENLMPDLDNSQDKTEYITSLIEAEMDALGVGKRYKGREYLVKAICMLACGVANPNDSIMSLVAREYKKTYSSIIRAMQTAINQTWWGGDIDELGKHYTARIDRRMGTPTPNEFIHYYLDKIGQF